MGLKDGFRKTPTGKRRKNMKGERLKTSCNFGEGVAAKVKTECSKIKKEIEKKVKEGVKLYVLFHTHSCWWINFCASLCCSSHAA